MNRLCVLGALFVALVGLVGVPSPGVTQAQVTSGRMAMFEDVARQSGVPVSILVGLAWEQSGLTDHGGRPSIDGGYGLLDLSLRPEHDTLGAAAALVHRVPLDLRRNDRLNLLGGALLLARYERTARRLGNLTSSPGSGPADLGDWSPAIVRFTGMRSRFAAHLLLDDMFGRLRQGIYLNHVSLSPVPLAQPRLALLHGMIAPLRSHQTVSGSADFPGAVWQPANATNFSAARRPVGHRIRYLVIHDTEGSCAAAVNWFQNSAAQASAHYVVCQDGTVIQTVRESNIAWHAGNWPINQESIGIEHEGYADAANYTRAQYLASAALVRYLCHKYNIDPNRDTIFGHENVPAAAHTDPGPNWNWSFYMERVRHDAAGYSGGSTAVVMTTREDLVHSCPRTTCAVLGSANWGEQFALLAQRPGWEQVEYAGEPGWIADTGVAGGSGYVVQTTGSTILRDGPTLKANAIVTVPAGQRYVSMVQDGRWWYVAYNHRYGFLPVSSLRVTDCRAGQLAPSAPVAGAVTPGSGTSTPVIGAGIPVLAGCLTSASPIVAVPNTASAGDTISVAARSAPSNVSVSLALGGVALGSYVTDGAGQFGAEITLPHTVTSGKQTLSAVGTGVSLGTLLRVLTPMAFQPHLALSQSDVTPGQHLTLGGDGFPGLNAIDLTLALTRTDGTTKHMLIHTFSQPSGVLAPVHVTVPLSATAGTYTVMAHAPGAQGQATLTVEGESAIGTPGTGTPTPDPSPTASSTPVG